MAAATYHIAFSVSSPRNNAELKAGSPIVIDCDPKRAEIVARQDVATKKFIFDKVFDTKSKQIEIYKHVVEPMLDEVMTGYNCTVFA